MVNGFTSRLFLFVLICLGFAVLTTPAQAGGRQKPVIEKITVEGNRGFSDGKIKDQMSFKENRW
jgi:outer membrane protein assembly factor BamA